MSHVPSVRVTGKAAQFLLLLQDFGHLDETTADRILLDIGAANDGASIDLDMVRRAVAEVLFAGAGGLLSEGQLGEDWTLLFG